MTVVVVAHACVVSIRSVAGFGVGALANKRTGRVHRRRSDTVRHWSRVGGGCPVDSGYVRVAGADICWHWWVRQLRVAARNSWHRTRLVGRASRLQRKQVWRRGTYGSISLSPTFATCRVTTSVFCQRGEEIAFTRRASTGSWERESRWSGARNGRQCSSIKFFKMTSLRLFGHGPRKHQIR